MKHIHVRNGDHLRIRPGEYYHFVCCDCSLDHLFTAKSVRGGVELVMYRDDYETKRERKRVKK